MTTLNNVDTVKIECIVAAILTAAVAGGGGTTPTYIVNQYARTLSALRKIGGPEDPQMPRD